MKEINKHKFNMDTILEEIAFKSDVKDRNTIYIYALANAMRYVLERINRYDNRTMDNRNRRNIQNDGADGTT